MLQVGLAEAIQWVHVRDLRGNLVEGYVAPTRAEVLARAAESSKAIIRNKVHARLEKEKMDPTLRATRENMLCWSRTDLFDQKACIFDALREVGECLCRKPGRSDCEMCRAERAGEPAGESSGQSGAS
jgi:hypothetical protein